MSEQKNIRNDWDACLSNRRLVASPDAKQLAEKELSEAFVDLEAADANFAGQKYKWATIQAYYAMFHAARALLYSQGYRERGHACLLIAIEKLFGKTGLMEMRLVRALANGMALREDADYAAEYSQAGAEKIFKDAKEFVQKAREILGKK